MTTTPHSPPVTLDAGKVSVALGDSDTPGLVLLTIAMCAFGDAVLGDDETGVEPMDPTEMWAGLNEAYGTWITEEGENKLNALTLALQGDLFYRDVDVFQSVCGALYDGDLGDMISGVFEDLTAAEIMWGVMEVELAREDEEGPPEFSDGVAALIRNALALEQDDQTELHVSLKESYIDLLNRLKNIGVPLSALRLFDAEYAETVEALDELAANPAILDSLES